MPRRGLSSYANSLAGSDNEGRPENDDGTDATPRFNRGAIDIVMGLEKKRERRREKLYRMHCRKTKAAAHKGKDRKVAPGKGAEKMRDLGLGLNAYRGKGPAVVSKPRLESDVVRTARDGAEGVVNSVVAGQQVHMMSY